MLIALKTRTLKQVIKFQGNNGISFLLSSHVSPIHPPSHWQIAVGPSSGLLYGMHCAPLLQGLDSQTSEGRQTNIKQIMHSGECVGMMRRTLSEVCDASRLNAQSASHSPQSAPHHLNVTNFTLCIICFIRQVLFLHNFHSSRDLILENQNVCHCQLILIYGCLQGKYQKL